MRTIQSAAIGLFVLATSAYGATNTLVTLAEDELANGNCTLREAILATITGAAVDACDGDPGPDTIVLMASGTYDFDDGEMTELPPGSELTVRGAAPLPRGSYVIDLGGMQRLARLSSGARLQLENLEVTGGFGLPGITLQGGGAIHSLGGHLGLRNIAISDSSAVNGGAIETVGSGTLDLENVELSNNRADAMGSPLLHYGGGLRIHSFGNPPIRLVNVRFVANRIEGSGPGHLGNGGGMALYSGLGGDVLLRGLVFDGNWVDVDGTGAGAGLYADCEGTGTRFELEDSEFRNNRFLSPSLNDAAAAFFLDIEGFPAASLRRIRAVGSATDGATSLATLTVGFPTTLLASDLLLAEGGAIGLEATSSLSGTELVLGNLTVTGQAGTGLVLREQAPASLRLENSIVFGNALSSGSEVDQAGTTPEISPETLIGVDPGFVDAASGDFRLAAASPAADAGDSTFTSVGLFDLAHGPRRVGPEIDLGAFERGGTFADGFETGDAHAWSATLH
jgi:hypothetical protein